MTGRTSIVVVTFNHRRFIVDCVRAVERAGIAAGAARLILVDNASTDGTADVIREQVLAADGAHTPGGLPVLFVASDENLGFAGGNNLAIRRALDDGDEFVYLLNPDTEAEPRFLDEAIAAARTDGRVALVQSLLLRHPETDVVNTYGNALHFLGVGYAAGDGTPLDAPDVVERLARGVHDVAYASGAGVLVRASALREIGGFDEELFAYHEDLELSWRARLAGHRVVLAPLSRVRHKYEFSRSVRKYYWIERNRFLVLAWCYDWRTLVLILPALTALEAGLWAFALAAGWWREKARAYAYFLEPGRIAAVLATRRRVQALRRAPDSAVTALFTGEVVFPSVRPWLLTHVGNPALQVYWRGVRSLLRW